MEKYVIDQNYTIEMTIDKMEKELIKGVIVVNDDRKVVGLFTNGDMRAYFLRNGQLYPIKYWTERYMKRFLF